MPRSRDPGYKSILVKNETSESTVYLFVYAEWDPVCWLKRDLKSIPPGKEYLYRSKSAFKYQLRKQSKVDRNRTIISPTKLWTANKRLLIADNVDLSEDDLSKYPSELQICVRRNNMEDEITCEYGRDLYGILQLNVKEVRKMSKEQQDKTIITAFRRLMFLHHPDRNPDLPDSHLCQEVTMAYSILGDREKRAKYHDEIDYNGGWLSWSRLKVIFKPEAHGKYESIKRIGLLLFSTLLVGGGVVVGFMTSGLAPASVIAFNLLTGGMIGGGISGGLRTVCYDSIAGGVSVNKYLNSAAIGTTFGAVAGVATAGIAGATVGIGSSALSVTEVSATLFVETGAATGSVNGAMALLSSDADRALVDGEDVSFKEVVSHALLGGAFGAAAGAVAGIGSKGLHARASTVTVEGEVIEQGSSKLITKTVARHAANIGTAIEKAGTKSLTTGLKVIEENLNELPETCCSHDDSCEKDKEEKIKLVEVYFSPEENDIKVIRYICKESWESRMIVEYADATKLWRRSVVDGSGSTFEIPYGSTNVIVGFQAKRFFSWCGVKKYDRIAECWCQPTIPHVFWFDEPVSHTFTLDGDPFYEKVSKVTNERYDELDML